MKRPSGSDESVEFDGRGGFGEEEFGEFEEGRVVDVPLDELTGF